jgi:hypothetical protein
MASTVDGTADQFLGDETRFPAPIDIALSLEPNRPRRSGGCSSPMSKVAHSPVRRTSCPHNASAGSLHAHAHCCEDLQRRWLSRRAQRLLHDSIRTKRGHQHENPRHVLLSQAGAAAWRSHLESWQTDTATRQTTRFSDHSTTV